MYACEVFTQLWLTMSIHNLTIYLAYESQNNKIIRSQNRIPRFAGPEAVLSPTLLDWKLPRECNGFVPLSR